MTYHIKKKRICIFFSNIEYYLLDLLINILGSFFSCLFNRVNWGKETLAIGIQGKPGNRVLYKLNNSEEQICRCLSLT